LKIKLACLLLAALITTLIILPACTVSAQTGASSAISSAQATLNSCFEAAKQAEASGANITALQNTLNSAGELLSQAEYANSINDYASANSYAQQSQGTLANFVSEANSLKNTASQQLQMSYLLNVVGSIAGAFAVVGGSVGVWFYLSRKNSKQAEEKENESSTT
jgi:ABC-type transport system involved in cytochrome bd biosynthesis fused ATPase/permease subunit